MPWKVTVPVDERVKFVAAVLEGKHSVSALCDAFDVSRKTAYKWLGRYRREGPEGLLDRSRARKTSPRIEPAVEELIVSMRKRHPTWGPKKILTELTQSIELPARSTVANVLARHMLVTKRRKRAQQAVYASPLKRAQQSNDVWCVDFKGDFRLANGRRCYPLTMTDAYSRFLLCCRALHTKRTPSAWDVFEEIFREYGLPLVIRSDNGTPFSSTGGLSTLAIWWIKMGIRPERIAPGQPQQNGSHERMHRTLKAEATRPAKANHKAQQREFNRFVQVYNEVRPHEGIGMKKPKALYRPSPRLLPDYLPELSYPKHFETRRVSSCGQIKLNGRGVFVSHALKREQIGLEQREDGLWIAHFGMLQIGVFDERLTSVDKTFKLGVL